MKRHIRLRGVAGSVKGQVWESSEKLRVGRHESAEIRLDDPSVSRHHAEIVPSGRGWRVHDLGSTNGTYLNGNRLGKGDWPLQERDLLEFGEFTLVVDSLVEGGSSEIPLGGQMRVEATARASLEEALEALAFDSRRCPRPGEQLVALLRANHHLGHTQSEDALLRGILEDAVAVLDAQRGAIVLADESDGALRLRAVTTGRAQPREQAVGLEPASRPCYSQRLAHRAFNRGESILCHSVADDPELALAQSINEGAMDSVLCVLLRTPRGRLGVLHLDRSPWQHRFNAADLHLADALAASVSAGIESAQLLRKQRDLFLNTITMLAQAVELRDEYTGGHTARVTTYSLLLAEQLKVSAEELDLIRIGTPLHDIGKIGIDDAILRKPDKLTPAEYEAMKQHTVKGDEILATCADLKAVRPIVRSHHERWDGHGYPDGLAGEAIPALARIVAVADAFDAMTSDRPYRKGMPLEMAFAEVEKQSGKQFDPHCAGGFLAIRDRVGQQMQTQVLPVTPMTMRMFRG
ncbi:MAG TPA: HD domain-containing phosphohydrolase [Gemmataceae bacterium]|nr:HD domain-containing phosphohydrolase [Gemmataceae bacterium]